MRNTPAVTIVAAWISAETGVGPSIASGSQTYNGNCALLPIAPTKSSSAIAVTLVCERWGAAALATRVVERSDLLEDQEHREHEAEVADRGS